MEILETLHIIVAVGCAIVVVFVLAYLLLINWQEKSGKQDEPAGSCLVRLLVCIIVVLLGFALLGKCGGGGGEWEPRHTYIQKPVQNNVNVFIFPFSSYQE